MEVRIARMCGRNPERPTSRKRGLPTEQRLEPLPDGMAGALTTVQKDNMLIEEKDMEEKENGFFKQALETAERENAREGDTVDAFNGRVNKTGLSPTLTTRPEDKKTAILPVVKKYRVRKLTEKECWRLMGYKDSDFEKNKAVNSACQLYKQAGNAIIKQVLMAIFLQMGIQGKKRWNDMSAEERQALVDGSLDFLGEKNAG